MACGCSNEYKCSSCGRCYQHAHRRLRDGSGWYWLCKGGRRRPAYPDR